MIHVGMRDQDPLDIAGRPALARHKPQDGPLTVRQPGIDHRQSIGPGEYIGISRYPRDNIHILDDLHRSFPSMDISGGDTIPICITPGDGYWFRHSRWPPCWSFN